jgi:multimeric flavodoxin WrbA
LNILGIVGSPRRGGNTEILVDEVLRGAEEVGALSEKIILNKLNIKPCQACNTCYKTGKCIQNDDMISLLEKMKESNVWVLGTPIYWWGPTAQFKAFLDRWYNPIHQEFKGKHVILVIPLEGDHERYARHTIGIFTDVLNYLNMKLFETIVAPGVGRRGEVREKENILKKAYRAGLEIIKKNF